MTISSILSTGVQSMQAGINRTAIAAGQIASLGGQDPNVAKNMVELGLGAIDAKAAANVIKTGDEMIGTIIDIRG
jgi:hypothetical protein